jgi:hypothetical protein
MVKSLLDASALDARAAAGASSSLLLSLPLLPLLLPARAFAASCDMQAKSLGMRSPRNGMH